MASLKNKKISEFVVDGITATITDSTAYENITIRNGGKLIIAATATNVTTESLTMENGILENNGSLSVTKPSPEVFIPEARPSLFDRGKFIVSGTENRLLGTPITAEIITLKDDSELNLDKNQYDALLTALLFTDNSTGKFVVSKVAGNTLHTKDIDRLMAKIFASGISVNFQQDLVGLNTLHFHYSQKGEIILADAIGTSGNDSIRIHEGVDITLRGDVFDLEQGNNSLKIDEKANATILASLVNVNAIQIGKKANAIIGSVTSQAKATRISVEKGGSLQLNGGSFSKYSDRITAAANTTVLFGTQTESAQAGMTDFTGATLSFGTGADLLQANGSLFATGYLNFDDGNDRLIVGKQSRFLAAENWTGDWETADFGTGKAATIDFGAGNDKIAIGKEAAFSAGDILNLESVTLGTACAVQLCSLRGTKNVSAGKNAVLTASDMIGTSENDHFLFGNSTNTHVTGTFSLGKGNDTLKIGTDSTFSTGALDFGAGNNNLSIGNRSSATIEGSLSSVKKLTLSNGTYNKKTQETNRTSLTAALLTGTDGNDTLSLGNYTTVNLTGLNFSQGNDVLAIGNNDTANISGNIQFSSGKNKIQIGYRSQVVLKSSDATNVNKFTIGRETTAYLSSELASAVTTAHKTARIFDIGAFDVAQNFVCITSEQEDDAFASARSLDASEYHGWLCGENGLDATDFFLRSNATTITGFSPNLLFAQYDADGALLPLYAADGALLSNAPVAFNGTFTFAANATAFSISLADENTKAIAYTMLFA